jgi:hypothetical protein
LRFFHDRLKRISQNNGPAGKLTTGISQHLLPLQGTASILIKIDLHGLANLIKIQLLVAEKKTTPIYRGNCERDEDAAV